MTFMSVMDCSTIRGSGANVYIQVTLVELGIQIRFIRRICFVIFLCKNKVGVGAGDLMMFKITFAYGCN